MIDSHCHLADEQFAADLTEVIARAHAAGITQMVTIGNNMQDSKTSLDIAEKYEHIFCTVGVHPHEAKHWTKESPAALAALATSSSTVKAIGEIGLDYHYDFSPREDQKRAFAEQLMIAQELNLPVVIHNRESIDDLKAIIAEHSPVKLVMHCCTEKWENVRSLVEQGYLLSFTGMATYPKLTWIRETMKECPLEQIMIETDAPYLAPEGKRGKRCEPADVTEVLKLLAEIKGISVEEADRVTTENTVRFFGIDD